MKTNENSLINFFDLSKQSQEKKNYKNQVICLILLWAGICLKNIIFTENKLLQILIMLGYFLVCYVIYVQSDGIIKKL